MYGEHITIDGITVFVLCTPGVSKQELQKRAQAMVNEIKERRNVEGCKGHDLNCNCTGKCFTNR